MEPQIRVWFEKRIKNPHVLERVLRANEGIRPGDSIRGWRRKDTAAQHRWEGRIPKSEFIARHGRARWAVLPHGLLIKDGRRRYVTMTGLLTVERVPLAMLPALRVTLRARYPTLRYANDPRGVPVCWEGEWDEDSPAVAAILAVAA